jgi:hypothetical protein
VTPVKNQQHNNPNTKMPKTSFTDLDNDTPEPGSSKELAVRENRAPAVSAPSIEDPDKGLLGEWTYDDIKLPRLNLVNKSGQLADNFTPGTFVINSEHALSELTDKDTGGPLTVIGVRMKKQYQENISFDDRDTITARVFDTAAEVRENGGRVSWRDKGPGFFSEMAHIELLVQKPESLSEEVEPLFFYSVGDHSYARVIYTVGSTAFTSVAVTMASALRGHLAETGLIGGFWLLGSKLRKNEKNSWWSPTLRSAGKLDSASIEQIKAIL